MAHELWSHGLDRTSCGVHPTLRVDVPTGTVGEFVPEYLTPEKMINRIICQCSVNESVQLTGFPKIWGSSLTYIYNAALLDATKGWGWNGTDSTIYTVTINIPSYTGN